MSSYVVTGASRGLGFEMLKQLSADPKNKVVGLVRNKEATLKKMKEEGISHRNTNIVEADLVDYESLKRSAETVSGLLNGSLDYLIANAAYVSSWSFADSFTYLGASDPAMLTQDMLNCFNVNVIGQVHLFNVYLPLIRNGSAKKVILIGAGHADISLMTQYNIFEAGPYTISKAAANAVVGKYAAELQDEGILFLSICPGPVDTTPPTLNEHQQEMARALSAKYVKYAPSFTGPSTPAESVSAVLSLMDKASIADGYSGNFISHKGKGEKWI